MAHLTTMKEPKATNNRQRGREEVALNLIHFEEIRSKKNSQRQAAKEMSVPRTSIQSWLKRLDKLDASPVVKAFFESPEAAGLSEKGVAIATDPPQCLLTPSLETPTAPAAPPFATHFLVVNKLEKTEITWQFLLRNAAIGSQPGTKQRPKTFHSVNGLHGIHLHPHREHT